MYIYIYYPKVHASWTYIPFKWIHYLLDVRVHMYAFQMVHTIHASHPFSGVLYLPFWMYEMYVCMICIRTSTFTHLSRVHMYMYIHTYNIVLYCTVQYTLLGFIYIHTFRNEGTQLPMGGGCVFIMPFFDLDKTGYDT